MRLLVECLVELVECRMYVHESMNMRTITRFVFISYATDSSHYEHICIFVYIGACVCECVRFTAPNLLRISSGLLNVKLIACLLSFYAITITRDIFLSFFPMLKHDYKITISSHQTSL